jgi:thiamine-monophosphate kinase
LKTDCAEFGVAVIGGDTVVTDGPLTLSLTAFGQVPKNHSLLRRNARSGDNIWVSGSLGDSAFGLLVAKKEAQGLDSEHASYLLDRYRLPQPRLALGLGLRDVAHAAMDISDGLIGDLTHLCAASHLAAELDAGLLPLSPAGRAALDLGLGRGIETVAGGGDDYELLFTAPPSADARLRALSEALALDVTRIGVMRDGAGVTLRDSAGNALSVACTGYQHFAGVRS